jgi:hypothetical protein
MIPRNEVAAITSEIERLQRARNECMDTGLQQRIDLWIDEQKQKLLTEERPKAPASRRPGENARLAPPSTRFVSG